MALGMGCASYRLADGHLTIHEGVTTIENDQFKEKNLTSVTISSSVTSIGNGAFSGNQFTTVIIPNSVTSIEKEVFKDNPLISVTISDNIASFDNSVFAGARNLTKITIGANVKITGIEDMAYNFQGLCLGVAEATP